MNVRKEVVTSLVMALLMLSGMPLISIAFATNGYPPLPSLDVTYSGTATDVWLTVDGYWDVAAFDIFVRFNVDAIEATSVTIDPDQWFKSFWPSIFGVLTILKTIDNNAGIVRTAFVGIPAAGGVHTPPSGTGRLLHIEWNVVDASKPPEIYLMNPLPRPSIDPWGSNYFLVDIAGIPHPERPEAPWNGGEAAPFIPHVITLPAPIPPVADIAVSTKTPEAEEVIVFDASGSYDPETFGGIVSYEWDFGDGTTASGVTVSHSYVNRGFYEVTLTLTDNDGLTSSSSVIIGVNVLQRAFAEHHVYRVGADEDQFNDLTVRGINFGTASAQVKAVFRTYDKRTGMKLGPDLEATGTAQPGSTFDLTVGWNPADFGWPGTKAKYEVRVDLYFLDDWTLAGSFKIVFKVVP